MSLYDIASGCLKHPEGICPRPDFCRGARSCQMLPRLPVPDLGDMTAMALGIKVIGWRTYIGGKGIPMQAAITEDDRKKQRRVADPAAPFIRKNGKLPSEQIRYGGERRADPPGTPTLESEVARLRAENERLRNGDVFDRLRDLLMEAYRLLPKVETP